MSKKATHLDNNLQVKLNTSVVMNNLKAIGSPYIYLQTDG